ncbi:MAG: aminopeptidase N [Hyphomicrobiales bacterium]|nr:aminopeptidase N [Hyphomicrobiales bacterium]
MRTEQSVPIRLEDYRPPDWLVETVDLDVSLHPTATRVRAVLRLKPNPQAATPAPLVLDGDGLTLVSLRLDGETLAAERYTAAEDGLTIAQPPPRPFTLTIETALDPSANTQLMGLYRSGSTYCTQCEAEGFRRITYYPDRPDVMAVFTTRIEADKAECPVLLGNGNPVAAGDLPGSGRHYAVWHDPFPKPAYLFALVGGDLACIEERFRTMSGRDVTLRIYVEPGNEARTAYAMDALKRAMRWDEKRFGREYDLDIFMVVAVSTFNMGAMENKGLNIFNDKYVLATTETATDADFMGIEAVIAHEYFHNWTGNRITCRDWFQLCLKEGLTVFRDQEFRADQNSRAVERIRSVRALRAMQFVEDAGPLAHPVRPALYREINNFYTPTVYEKGAEVVRMIQTLLGVESFRKGMDLYFQRHDGEAATVEQFVQCFADASGAELSQMLLWYAQAGTPEIVVTGSHDARSRTFQMEVAQTLAPTPGQPTKEPMLIPLAIGLIGRDGCDLPLKPAGGGSVERGVLALRRSSETFVFEEIAERPVMSLNRNFSAPVRLVANLSGNDLRFLAAHDCDPFNRWEALQSLATRLLTGNVAAIRSGGVPGRDDGLIGALAAILDDDGLDPAFVALALTPPSEADIAREIARDVDPDAIFAARTALRADLGRMLGDALRRYYDALTDTAPYRPDAAGAGRRALRNTSLDLMVAARAPDAIVLAAQQYRAAGNMTDRMAALGALSLCDCPERQSALDDFYARFADNALVIDKWFSLQASIPEPATLARVEALAAHPAFSMGNPNRVRALFGAFAMSNQTQLNRADGAGYALLTDAVLALDQKNPQVAARLLTSLKSWRVLEARRRALAEAALRKVAAAPTLSRDVADIVARALADA